MKKVFLTGLFLVSVWAATQRDTTKRFFPPRGDYGYTFEVDPSVPSAADFIVDLETECARKYPGIDGIESDIENDTTGSYSDIERIRFMKDTGKPDPLTLPDTDPAWLSWRRLQVTTIVKRIYEGIKRVNPRCVVSAAVDPPFYGQKWKLESWDVWARKHYVDFLEPMLYVRRDIFDDQLKWCLGNVPSGFKLNAGVAINFAGSAANTVYEIRQARRMGAAGIVVWYYGYLLSYPDAMMDLKSQVFTGKTLPSYDDLVIDVANAEHFHTSGVWTAEKGGYGGTYRSAPAAQGDTAIFSTRILRSGDYTLYGYWAGDSSSNCSQAIVQTSTPALGRTDTANQKLHICSWESIDKFH